MKSYPKGHKDLTIKEGESVDKTFGCKCYNPENCKNCGSKTCAFFNKDNICTTPPQSWRRQFIKKIHSN